MTASNHLLHTCTNSRAHMSTHEQVHVVASSCHGAQSTAEVEKQVPCGPQAAPVWAPSARVCALCPVAFVGLAWGYTRQRAGVILGGLRGAYEVLGIELESVMQGKHALHLLLPTLELCGLRKNSHQCMGRTVVGREAP